MGRDPVGRGEEVGPDEVRGGEGDVEKSASVGVRSKDHYQA